MSIGIENLLLIMVVVWTTGMIFRAVKLPLLLGELLAGLIFGPALLGLFHETETIKILAELGIFFLMLHAGLETEPKQLLHSSRHGLIIALMGMMVPFGLGLGVSLLFDTTLIQALFIGIAVSITAVSVTAKIFNDFSYKDKKITNVVMVAGVANDIVAFIALSLLLNFVSSGGLAPEEVGLLILKVVVFFGAILFVGEKVMKSILQKFFNATGGKAFTLTLIIALFFGVIAEWVGIHFVIGAYMAGLFVKEEMVSDKIYKKIEDRLFGLSYSFLGPIFFVSLGFHISFSVFEDPHTTLFLLAILAVAIIGKVFGAGIPAKLVGFSNKDSSIIGFAMNGRGAVELILASIGLEQGIITPEIFSILVFMAFVTTFLMPISLKFVLPKANKTAEIAS